MNNDKSLIQQINEEAQRSWKKNKRAVKKYRFGNGKKPRYATPTFPTSRASFKR